MSRTTRNTYMQYWTTHRREEYSRDPFWLRYRNARGTIHGDDAFNGRDGIRYGGREAHGGAPKGFCSWNSCGMTAKADERRLAQKIMRNRGKRDIRDQLKDMD